MNSDGIELLNLGDAYAETKQGAPGVSYADSQYYIGRWPGFLDDVS